MCVAASRDALRFPSDVRRDMASPKIAAASPSDVRRGYASPKRIT